MYQSELPASFTSRKPPDEIKANSAAKWSVSLAPTDGFDLPEQLRGELRQFLLVFPVESLDWFSIRAGLGGVPAPSSCSISCE